MNLKFRNLLCVISMLLTAQFSIHAQATKEVVDVKVPGTLQKVLDDLESSRFESLTIKGGLNAADIAYLNSGKEKVAMIETLDLSDVTLVPGDESYITINVGRSSGPSGWTYNVYYISDTYETFYESYSNGLGGSNAYNHIFCNDLSGAFYRNSSFEKVILPKSMENVGSMMFVNSTINEVILNENILKICNGAFGDCKNLKTISLPQNMTIIEDNAFSGSAIENIVLPKGITEIYNHVFAQTNLASINLDNVHSIGEGAFRSTKLTSANLENVSSVGEYAFAGTPLTGELNISKIDSIPDYAFETNITSVIFSPNLRFIGDGAFYGTNLSSIDLPNPVTHIGSRAFYDCKLLSEVKIPSTVSQIGKQAFDDTPWGNNLKSENGVVYIANVAYKYDYDFKFSGDAFSLRDGTLGISDGFSFTQEMKDNVKTLKLPQSLLEIGDEAFSGFKVLGEVKLPSSLKRIGSEAFKDCPKFWCTLPESLYSIGAKAFYSCTTLSQVTLPKNLQYIGYDAFAYTSVGTVTVYSENLETKNFGYNTSNYHPFGDSLKKVKIGSNVKKLCDRLFDGGRLKTVEFEDVENAKLAYIGKECFSGNFSSTDSLTFYNFPETLTHIGDYAFLCCKFTSEPNLRNLKYLGEGAFGGCRGFESIVIPESVDSIGREVFSYCNDLKHVEFNAKVLYEIPYNSTRAGGMFEHCDSLQSATIGPKVRKLPDYMFYECRKLKDITFAPRTTSRSESENAESLSIGKGAFQTCRGLNEIELPLGTDSIGTYAFYCCSILNTLNIPSSCRYLGKDVFWGSNSLKTIYFNSIEPPVFEGALFGSDYEYPFYQSITIYVPEESYDLYKSQVDLWRYNVVAMPNSAIEDVFASGESSRIISVYDLNGRVAIDNWTNGTKGIYILKMSDGTARKVIR